MGEKSDAKLMYYIDGKEFKELPEINGIKAGTVEASSLDDFKIRRLEGGAMTFSCGCVPKHKILEAFLGRILFIQFCQSTKSNNWLRRHGLPMRRKIR